LIVILRLDCHPERSEGSAFKDLLFSINAENRVPHPFAHFAKGWESTRLHKPVILTTNGRKNPCDENLPQLPTAFQPKLPTPGRSEGPEKQSPLNRNERFTGILRLTHLGFFSAAVFPGSHGKKHTTHD
jgi:hypothetical protein